MPNFNDFASVTSPSGSEYVVGFTSPTVGGEMKITLTNLTAPTLAAAATDATTKANAAQAAAIAAAATDATTKAITAESNAVASATTLLEDRRNWLNHGVVEAPTLTDNGDGSISVGANGVIQVHPDIAGDLSVTRYALTSAGPFTLTDGVTNYIIATSTGYSATTSVAFFNDLRYCAVAKIYRAGNFLHILSYGDFANNLPEKLLIKDIQTAQFLRISGLALSESATRVVNVSAGAVYFGVNPIVLAASASNVNTTLQYHRVSGVWTGVPVTQYNNTQYDDGTNLQTLNNNQYGVVWVYRGVEASNHTYLLLGSASYTLPQAQSAQPDGLPDAVSSHGMLIGRIIVQKNASTATEIDQVASISFQGVPVTNHNDTSGIQGGAVGDYQHLTTAQVAAIASSVVATPPGMIVLANEAAYLALPDGNGVGSKGAAATANKTALQTALTNNDVVWVSAPGVYPIVGPITLKSGNTLRCSPGVVFYVVDSAHVAAPRELFTNISAHLEGATIDKSITIEGLTVVRYGNPSVGYINSYQQLNLNGIVTFFWVNGVTLRNIRIFVTKTVQFGIHICECDTITVDQYTARGALDGLHFSSGNRNIVARNIIAQTADDGVAFIMAEWRSNNLWSGGSVYNAVIENYDYKKVLLGWNDDPLGKVVTFSANNTNPGTLGVDPGTGSASYLFFGSTLSHQWNTNVATHAASVCVGAWLDWVTSTTYTGGDIVVNNGRMYWLTTVTGGTVSTAAPVHSTGTVTGADGLAWIYIGPAKAGADKYGTNMYGLVVRNVTIDGNLSAFTVYAGNKSQTSYLATSIFAGAEDKTWVQSLKIENLAYIGSNTYTQPAVKIQCANIRDIQLSGLSYGNFEGNGNYTSYYGISVVGRGVDNALRTCRVERMSITNSFINWSGVSLFNVDSDVNYVREIAMKDTTVIGWRYWNGSNYTSSSAWTFANIAGANVVKSINIDGCRFSNPAGTGGSGGGWATGWLQGANITGGSTANTIDVSIRNSKLQTQYHWTQFANANLTLNMRLFNVDFTGQYSAPLQATGGTIKVWAYGCLGVTDLVSNTNTEVVFCDSGMITSAEGSGRLPL